MLTNIMLAIMLVIIMNFLVFVFVDISCQSQDSIQHFVCCWFCLVILPSAKCSISHCKDVYSVFVCSNIDDFSWCFSHNTDIVVMIDLCVLTLVDRLDIPHTWSVILHHSSLIIHQPRYNIPLAPALHSLSHVKESRCTKPSPNPNNIFRHPKSTNLQELLRFHLHIPVPWLVSFVYPVFFAIMVFCSNIAYR